LLLGLLGCALLGGVGRGLVDGRLAPVGFGLVLLVFLDLLAMHLGLPGGLLVGGGVRIRLLLSGGRPVELALVPFALRRLLLFLFLVLALRVVVRLLLGAGAIDHRLLLGRQRPHLSGRRRLFARLGLGWRRCRRRTTHDRRTRRRQRAERRRRVGRV